MSIFEETKRLYPDQDEKFPFWVRGQWGWYYERGRVTNFIHCPKGVVPGYDIKSPIVGNGDRLTLEEAQLWASDLAVLVMSTTFLETVAKTFPEEHTTKILRDCGWWQEESGRFIHSGHLLCIHQLTDGSWSLFRFQQTHSVWMKNASDQIAWGRTLPELLRNSGLGTHLIGKYATCEET